MFINFLKKRNKCYDVVITLWRSMLQTMKMHNEWNIVEETPKKEKDSDDDVMKKGWCCKKRRSTL